MKKSEDKTPQTKFLPYAKKHPGITISISAIIITLSLYAYFLGVLDRFQLEPSLFPLSIERAYLLGVAFIVRTDWLILVVISLLLVVAFSLASSLLLSGITFLVNKTGFLISETFPKLRKHFSPIDLTATMSISFLLLVAFLLWLGLFYNLGKYKPVNRQIVDYSSTIKMKGKDGALYEDVALIVCEQFCAIHVGSNNEDSKEQSIILLPANEIEYIKQKLSPKKE